MKDKRSQLVINYATTQVSYSHVTLTEPRWFGHPSLHEPQLTETLLSVSPTTAAGCDKSAIRDETAVLVADVDAWL